MFVFHFRPVPEAMKKLVPSDSAVEARLTDAEVRRISRIYRTLRGCGNASDEVSVLRSQGCPVSLCLIIASRSGPPVKVLEGRPGNLVKSSLAWYENNMAAAPGLSAFARKSNVSASHLRRLYRFVLHGSPRGEFAKRRFSRAKYLLAVTSFAISEIAMTTGYGSPSSFSRAFRNGVGVPPEGWRRRQRTSPA